MRNNHTIYMTYLIFPASKIISFLEQKLSQIRTGRVNAAILDHITVDAYGGSLKLNEVATISIPEASQLMITPFDKSILGALEKAIQTSDLGVNPNNDGAGLRLSFPPLTEESRKVRTKEVAAYLEEARIAMRSQRQNLLKSKKVEKENSEISEDELKRFETQLQKEIDQLNDELVAIAKKKEEELMKM